VIPFDEHAEEMALALASQAGVSLENAILHDEIRRLFESFVSLRPIARPSGIYLALNRFGGRACERGACMMALMRISRTDTSAAPGRFCPFT